MPSICWPWLLTGFACLSNTEICTKTRKPASESYVICLFITVYLSPPPWWLTPAATLQVPWSANSNYHGRSIEAARENWRVPLYYTETAKSRARKKPPTGQQFMQLFWNHKKITNFKVICYNRSSKAKLIELSIYWCPN